MKERYEAESSVCGHRLACSCDCDGSRLVLVTIRTPRIPGFSENGLDYEQGFRREGGDLRGGKYGTICGDAHSYIRAGKPIWRVEHEPASKGSSTFEKS